ncbi:MAG: MotA/TolQ/ExbB proton channel family protein [Opitutaceae bacterium]
MLSTPQAHAADVATADAALDERVENALQLYKDQSATIADEKIPLVREINQLEDENISLREKIEATLGLTAENNRSYDGLRNRLEQFKTQSDFASRFLKEYIDSFESRIHVAEDQAFKERLTAIRMAIEDPSLPLSERYAQQLKAVELGLERIEGIFGGYQFEGKAIAPGGVIETGTVMILGPTAYFKSNDDSHASTGLLRFHAGTIEPSVLSFQGASASKAEEFFATGTGSLPLDATLGDAVEVRSANVRIVDHIAQGGPIGYATLALGAVALVLTFVKLFDLGRFHTVDTRVLGTIVRHARNNNEEEALKEVRKIRGPVGEMLEVGVRNIRANTVLLEEMMLSVVLRKRPEGERYLPFLAITAAAAPLLGLLGTVTGMIRTFALITVFGTGDPRALSGGISEALVTTEIGLMVAIPALVVHGVFLRMIRSRFGDMERVAFEFVRTISVEQSKSRPE